jgi:riboflavin synthase
MAQASPDVMFTGLIADLGSVTALHRGEEGATVEIRTPLAEELADGDSVAVNGVCLTAMNIHDESFQAQAMMETLARSSLGGLDAGARVNLELALRVGDRLGGHVVQGHVDGIGTVTEVREEGFARVVEIEIEPPLRRYVAEKGSVAVDGVSLTVSALHERGFAVSLIPETLSRTNLGAIAEGAQVNIEVDVLAKQVERLIEASPDRLRATGQRS